MAENPTETDKKPCPLTISDWIVFLTTKSQAKFGYKHLVVVLLLAALSIVIVFTETPPKTFGLSLLISVAFVAVIWYAIRTLLMLKERDENLEIVEEIISGDLTDSDEIRKQYYERRKTPDQM